MLLTWYVNLDINEFQLKVNDDMMQNITCNKLSLFAPRLKILIQQGNFFFNQCGTRKNFKYSWNERLIHSYIKLRHEQHCNANWIKFDWNWIELNK